MFMRFKKKEVKSNEFQSMRESILESQYNLIEMMESNAKTRDTNKEITGLMQELLIELKELRKQRNAN